MEQSELSRLPTGVSQRGGVFQLRIGVPSDLRHLYKGVDAYRGSLKTSDRATAITKSHALIAEHREAFDRQRTQETLKRSPPLVELTPELESYLVASTEWMTLLLDDVIRYTPGLAAKLPSPPQLLTSPEGTHAQHLGGPIERWDHLQQVVLDSGKADLAAGRLDNFKRAADAALSRLGVQVNWASLQGTLALARIGRAQLRSATKAVEKGAGVPHDTPAEPKAPSVRSGPAAASETAKTLRDLVPEWVVRTRAKDNAIQRTNKALRLFEEAVGTVPLDKLTKAIGGSFVAFLRDKPKRGFGDSTAANHAAAINALVNVAVKIDWLERNPFDLTFPIKDRKERESWTAEELALIYSAPEFTAPTAAKAVRGVEPDDAAMVLRVLLYTGARVGEIGQLATEDISVRDGIPTIHVHGENGTVKTKESVRRVPVAKGLEDLGFLEFVEMRRTAGDKWLFPSLQKKSVTPTDAFGKWFLLFRQRQGLPMGGLNASHKYRHLVRSTLAALGIGMETAEALTGHAATGSAGRLVYTRVPFQAVKAAANRLVWDFQVAPWSR